MIDAVIVEGCTQLPSVVQPTACGVEDTLAQVPAGGLGNAASSPVSIEKTGSALIPQEGLAYAAAAYVLVLVFAINASRSESWGKNLEPSPEQESRLLRWMAANEFESKIDDAHEAYVTGGIDEEELEDELEAAFDTAEMKLELADAIRDERGENDD
jgi:hypothetical protein